MRPAFPRCLRLIVLAWLCQCSLSLQNPEDEAKAKIAKKVPTTLETLSGRWAADSAYTTDDVKARRFKPRDLELEFYLDSTLHAADTVHQVFNADFGARISLKDDTLVVYPAHGWADTFYVKLRFMGNWLQLYRVADYRYLHFHRVKGPDSAVADSVLPLGLWSRIRRRTAFDTLVTEPLHRDFCYLRFPKDSLYWDTRVNGLSRVIAGPLARDGRMWTWTPPGGTRRMRGELLANDTLRVWTLDSAGLPDSGYSQFVKVEALRRYDLDVTPLLGYWRSDTVQTPFRIYENHFGRFYDLDLKDDHTVDCRTNMSLTPFRTWSMDSGFIFMTGDAPELRRARFRVTRAVDNSLQLEADSSSAFGQYITLKLTRVDGSRLAAHPLERFPNASYLHLTVGPDTLPYYFSANYNRSIPDRYEIAADSAESKWLALRLPPGSETSQSGQADFLFAVQARTATLGDFTCKAVSTLDLAIRLNSGSAATAAEGQIQGGCRITQSEIPPADSSLAIGGFFRLQRKVARGLVSPLWGQL